ncbi:tRNA:m(4)X modification enzyme TRM13 [Cocos nucifera]|uniref:tRNA:m(4)X modification enzyme TRM13 n=1 Tax=Cocos nucifera TaxID=13894 RepID=A0A8K0HTW8_COCNU|nr:tRNA:m(4)X modification enzyme TRM13 [Cocos nucifera]
MSCLPFSAAPDGRGGGGGGAGGEANMETRCQFWLPNKRRLCANAPLPSSHSVLNLESHIKRCPFRKQAQALESQPYYSKGINSDGGAGELEEDNVGSAAKRRAIFELSVTEFHNLVKKIKSIHSAIVEGLKDSYVVPDTCDKWLKQKVDRRLPYQEKHALQQASILGNMQELGILRKPTKGSHDVVCGECEISDGLDREEHEVPAVIEFGAGRGYLTHMLADCYGISKVFLVERRSYKLKFDVSKKGKGEKCWIDINLRKLCYFETGHKMMADRTLRQSQSIILERLRIDIEDLNLQAVETLRGLPYLAIGKHLCGPATGLFCILKADTKFLMDLGITKEDFHAMTWFSSWAVDADHSYELSNMVDGLRLDNSELKEPDIEGRGVEEAIQNMPAVDRAILGFMCKEIIDTGRLLWLREHGLDAQLVKYVSSNISPENHLLVAKSRLKL